MRFVLIGGGDIGTTAEKPYSLKEIDEEIVKMTGKAHPVMLFVGFNERANYIFGTMKKIYMALGVQCTYLKYTELSLEKKVESKFKRADIIYLNGGNTIFYMQMIRKYGLSKYLKTAIERNAIMCGISAGAIIYCAYGSSDSRTYKNNENKFTKVRGLGFVDALFSPHYSNSNRPLDIKRMTKRLKQISICADNNTALIIDNEKYMVIKSDKNANIYKCYHKNNQFFSYILPENGKTTDLISKI